MLPRHFTAQRLTDGVDGEFRGAICRAAIGDHLAGRRGEQKDIAATAGNYARVQYFFAEGVQFDPEEPVTIEMVADKIDKIRDMSNAKPYTGMMGNVEKNLRAMGRIK